MFTYLPEKALSMCSWSQLELVIVGKDQSFCLSCNSAPWQEIDLKARFCHDTESTLTWISTARGTGQELWGLSPQWTWERLSYRDSYWLSAISSLSTLRWSSLLVKACDSLPDWILNWNFYCFEPLSKIRWSNAFFPKEMSLAYMAWLPSFTNPAWAEIMGASILLVWFICGIC